ncbi:MAG: MBL fold metallo-hydrolase, partial [Microthrixaceae bacterium]
MGGDGNTQKRQGQKRSGGGQSKRSRSRGNQAKGNQAKGNQAKGNQAKGHQSNGGRSGGERAQTRKGSGSGARGGAAPVSVTFLGGLGEIGRNCAAIEQDGQILLIDCGLMFPDNDMLGIDLVLPDFAWLIERGDDIVGLVATHGHEDHVGGLSYLLRDVSFPIYGT